MDEFERLLNSLAVKVNRPGAEAANDNVDEHKEAADLCILKHKLSVPKNDGLGSLYVPSSSEVANARTYRGGLENLWRVGDPNRLVDGDQRKSLSSFTYGNNAFLLPPTLASQTLSCLVDPTD